MAQLTLAEKQAALDEIAKEIATCSVCRMDIVGVPVPGEGSADAEIVFLGEAPGKKESQTGRPFVGRSGQILRRAIVDAGLKEEDVFITSALKYLPKHVTPKPKEVEHGRTHLFAQLDIIQPKFVVLLGRIACLAMLEKNISVAKEHGTTIEKDGRTYFIMYHPAAVIYAQKLRGDFDADFKKLSARV